MAEILWLLKVGGAHPCTHLYLVSLSGSAHFVTGVLNTSARARVVYSALAYPRHHIGQDNGGQRDHWSIQEPLTVHGDDYAYHTVISQSA